MIRLTAMLTVTALLAAAPAHADSDDVLEALESMKNEMARMQKTIDAQNDRIRELESRMTASAQAPAAAGPAAGTSEERGNEIRQGVYQAAPWLKGTKFGGDLRLRTEYVDYFDRGPGATDRSRTRGRFRLRYGVEKDFGEGWKAGFRLASATSGTNGLATDNTSTNVTLGNPGEFSFKNIYIDRAYALYTPPALNGRGPLEEVTIGAGKVENPFLRHSGGIVWDTDVTPEGLYERAVFRHYENGDEKLSSQWTFGQFATNENSGLDTDAQLFAYQGAFAWSTGLFPGESPVELSSALSYYAYPNFNGTIRNNTLGTSLLRTNTAALDNPEVVDWYSEVVFRPGPRQVALWGDLVKNVGEIDETRESVSPHGDVNAWGLGVKLGRMKKKGEWEASYGYYEIGANAVVAAFNESDFGGASGLGYTNREGHKVYFGYQLTDAVQVNFTGYVVDTLVPAPASVAAAAADESTLKIQADLVWKF